MASDQSDIIKVDREDLYKPTTAVKIDDVEEVQPHEVTKDDSKEPKVEQPTADEGKSEPVVRETPQMKTTYDEEEAPKISMKDKIKATIGKVGDKFRPKEAVEANNADPNSQIV